MTMPNALESAVAVTRFGLGARPGELQAAAADPKGWLLAQIDPRGADQPPGDLPTSETLIASLLAFRQQVQMIKADATGQSAGNAGADKLGAAAKEERKDARRPLEDGIRSEALAQARLGALTDAAFRERWTIFWCNHFTVASSKLPSAVLAGAFQREAIRPHVFGAFETLLAASTRHPGMLIYLDQERSAGPDSQAGLRRKMGLNENLAREIMELHTVGADAGYTQADVTEFARALTGYSIGNERDGADRGRFLFRPELHEPGVRTIMGKQYADGGEDQARAVLADLAASPHTADHIARKLAVHFVADDPPPQLVARLKRSYLDTGGDLAKLAEALVVSPEAWSADARKFKTPYEFVVSAYRAAGAAPSDAAKEVMQPLTFLGQRPFSAPQPNGWSDLASDWAAPDALVKRLVWATRFSAAYVPGSTAPTDVGMSTLGARLSDAAKTALARAETRFEAFSILLMSPEFQRR